MPSPQLLLAPRQGRLFASPGFQACWQTWAVPHMMQSEGSDGDIGGGGGTGSVSAEVKVDEDGEVGTTEASIVGGGGGVGALGSSKSSLFSRISKSMPIIHC